MKSLILTAQDARDLEAAGGLTITKPIKPAPRYIERASFEASFEEPGKWRLVDENRKRLGAENGVADIFAPPVNGGDVVFIREPWYRLKNPSGGESDRVILAGDSSVGEDQVSYKWASPVSMPEAAARRFARVTSAAPIYNEAVTVWEITLEKIDKATAEAEDVDARPIVSEATDPENVSDYLTYAGDMSPEDHERMIAKIDADRARLAEIRERRKEIAAILTSDDKAVHNARVFDDVDGEDDALRQEEAELVEALTAAGVPVDEPEEREETETTAEPAEGETAAESAGDAPEEDEEIGSFLFGKCKYCGRE